MKKLITTLLLTSSIYAASLDLSWTDNSDNEDGFLIERSIDDRSSATVTAAQIACVANNYQPRRNNHRFRN